jgi:hypothetical protein
LVEFASAIAACIASGTSRMGFVILAFIAFSPYRVVTSDRIRPSLP